MRKLTPVLMAVALGAAIAMSAGAPYQLAEQQVALNRTPAAEILKTDTLQQAMFEAANRPALPPGMVLVWPDDPEPPMWTNDPS